MSTFPPRFQIISDLHLETPLASPSYHAYTTTPSLLPIHASNLLLLGDIGLVRDARLFAFLESLFARTPNLRVFYVLGNHESYGLTMAQARERLRVFERDVRRECGERFWVLERGRGRVDLDAGGVSVSVLGTTLWSRISKERERVCGRLMADFREVGGIVGRGVEEHNWDFEEELGWLNEQVKRIEEENKNVEVGGGGGGVKRQVLILTHHCPTTDPRAQDPRHVGSEVAEGFATDLRGERCWESEVVRCWAFGHTHWSCAFYDGGGEERGQGQGEERGKLVISNQKGYAGLEDDGKKKPVRSCVVEPGEDGVWRVVDCEASASRDGAMREQNVRNMKNVKEKPKSMGVVEGDKANQQGKQESGFKHALKTVTKRIRGG